MLYRYSVDFPEIILLFLYLYGSPPANMKIEFLLFVLFSFMLYSIIMSNYGTLISLILLFAANYTFANKAYPVIVSQWMILIWMASYVFRFIISEQSSVHKN